eukprot:907636-Pelagomonas_calceolata.AAC.4
MLVPPPSMPNGGRSLQRGQADAGRSFCASLTNPRMSPAPMLHQCPFANSDIAAWLDSPRATCKSGGADNVEQV